MRTSNFKATVNKMSEYNGYEISVTPVYKGTVKKTGITLRKKGVTAAPTIYIEDNTEIIEAAKTVKEVLDRFIEIAEANMTGNEFGDIESRFVPENLKICAVSSNAKEFLDRVIHRDILDGISIYARLLMNDEGTASTAVNSQILEKLGISESEMFERAISNTKFKISNIGEVLAMLGMPAEMIDECPLMVVTNPDKLHGAGVALTNLDWLKKNGKDMYILPSSIHEVLYLPVTENEDARRLVEIIKEVNTSEVAPEERLSDNLYFYDSAKQEIVDYKAA